MRLSTMHGLVRRRILLNFRVDPAIIQRQLPAPFRPKLLGDWALTGICVIRLEGLRPAGLPAAIGRASDNAAQRVAVTWLDETGAAREGVYIPVRYTSSPLNQLLGGRLFPGVHTPAVFDITDDDRGIELTLRTHTGEALVHLRAATAAQMPATTRFSSVAEAAAFFAAGSAGYSPRRDGCLEGLTLRMDDWRMAPLAVESLYARAFADERRFPPGSVEFDSALLMRDRVHAWEQAPAIGAAGAHGRPQARSAGMGSTLGA